MDKDYFLFNIKDRLYELLYYYYILQRKKLLEKNRMNNTENTTAKNIPTVETAVEDDYHTSIIIRPIKAEIFLTCFIVITGI